LRDEINATARRNGKESKVVGIDPAAPRHIFPRPGRNAVGVLGREQQWVESSPFANRSGP